MRRKSFRLPCRTISERSGRRSGHSPPPHPIAASLNNTRQNRRSSSRRTERASHHTTLRRAPPRQPHHDGRYPDLLQHRRYNTPAVPRYTAMHIASPYRTASPPCRTTDDARPFVSQPDGISRHPSRTAAAFFPKQNRIRGTLSRKNGYLCRAKVSEVSSGLRESIGNAVQFGDSTCCCEFRSSRQGEDDSATHSH